MSSPISNTQTPQTKSKKTYRGFTLVELIVVITILVILGTIAFVNLGGFQTNARDSVRVSNLTSLKQGLDIFQIKSGIYPMPENPVSITASGITIGYQGFAKDQIGSIAKLSPNGTLDPLDPTIYTTYLVSENKSKMQLMSFLEDGGNLTVYKTQKRIPLTPFVKGELIPTTFASTTSNYSQRFPTTLGDTLGILLSNSSGSLNQPVQETTNTGIDLTRTTTLSGYTLIFSKNDTTTSIVTSGSGAYTGSLFTFIYNQRDDLLHNKALASLDSSLVGYWDMETMTGNLLKDLSAYGNDGVLYGGIIIGGVDGNGKTGKATSFDGVDDGINISITKILTLPMSDFSLTSWVKTSDMLGQRCIVSTDGDGISGFRYGYSSSNSAYFLYGGYSEGYIGTQSTSDNIWHNLTMNFYLNDRVDVYVDGKRTGTMDTKLGYSAALNQSEYLVIGGMFLGGNLINAAIDEVRIYNRALVDSEIQTLYNATK